MLHNLKINNYALINNLNINFSKGFTVISGDTGSGKSIILDAISILLGKRLDKSNFNNKKCVIEAEFKISKNIESYFIDNNLDFDENTILRREININGKNRAFINDTPVSISLLSEFSSLIIEIHAQHENLLIKTPVKQLLIIDKLANNADLKLKHNKLFDSYMSILNDQKIFNQHNVLNTEDYNLLKFHYEEINNANIQINELDDLEKEINTLQNIHEISEIAHTSYSLLSDENLITDNLNKVKKILSKFEKFKDIYTRINTNLIDLIDISSDLKNILDNLSENTDDLDSLSNRLNVINNILSKHKVNTINNLFEFRDSIKVNINLYENFEIEKTKILEKLNKSYNSLKTSAKLLTKSRSKVVPKFEKEIKILLNSLAMPYAEFKISIKESNTISKNGIDNIKFQFSSNHGIAVQDIDKVASGGEISRLMLALKYKVSTYDGIETLIFDEIDTGVSGKIASYMGDLMLMISKKTQLISVTHLPQIASKSNDHLKVSKIIDNNGTNTEIKLLDKSERILEIAKLLSGKIISEAAITNAKELLNQ
jgi:DNA repair protein RecN (Recombination protein N)